MAITRRQFIKRTGFTAGAVLGTGIFGHPLVRQAMAATTNKYTIVLFLDGGNDGLNTITPINNGGGDLRTNYNDARSNLNLTPAQLKTLDVPGIDGHDPVTGAELGMHPGLEGIIPDNNPTPGDPGHGGLYQLYKDGHVAVVQGCGYPDYNLSHEESGKIWRTANPLYLGSLSGTGWMGRHLAHPSSGFSGADIPAVNIQNSIAGEFRQFTTSVVAANRLNDFQFPIDDPFGDDEAAKRAAFEALYMSAATPGHPLQVIGDAGNATYLSTDVFPQAHEAYEDDRDSWSDGYSQIDRTLARDFREIAKVIYAQEKVSPIAGVQAKYFQLSNGGYDTHSDQRGAQTDGQHYGLHAEVGAAIKHFFDDLQDMGGADLINRTMIVVWSEFARRIQQNDNGTDHGSQGPMFVIGGKVNGGVYGQHPNIAESDWNDDGNTKYRQSVIADPATDPYSILVPFRSTDFRDVYGTILTKWLGMTVGNALSILPADPGSASDYWTSPNFDLRRFDGGGALFLP